MSDCIVHKPGRGRAIRGSASTLTLNPAQTWWGRAIRWSASTLKPKSFTNLVGAEPSEGVHLNRDGERSDGVGADDKDHVIRVL